MKFKVQFVHWMLYKELEKMTRLNAFERDKKKPGLKFSPRFFFFALKTGDPEH